MSGLDPEKEPAPGSTPGAADESVEDPGVYSPPERGRRTPAQGEDSARADEGGPVTVDSGDLAELQRQAAERDALEERLKRVAADFANAQKRLVREAQTRIAYAVQEFATEVFPVADSLRRALAAAETSHDLDGFIEGIRLVDKQFYDILARHGIEPIEAVIGEVFDPEVHDVLAVTETDEYPPNAIVQEVERGFRLKGRVLRPATVIVAKGDT